MSASLNIKRCHQNHQQLQQCWRDSRAKRDSEENCVTVTDYNGLLIILHITDDYDVAVFLVIINIIVIIVAVIIIINIICTKVILMSTYN